MKFIMCIIAALVPAFSSLAADAWAETYSSKEATPTPAPIKASQNYTKIVHDAIGSRLYYYLNENLDKLSYPINVRIKVIFDSSGKLQNVYIDKSVIKNSLLADISVKASKEAEVPPFTNELKNEVGESISIVLNYTPGKAEQDAAANP